jgi:hypothetical protein
MQHLSTVVIGVWFELLVSTCHAASHCLLLCPSLDSVPKVALVNPKKLSTLLFLLTVEFLTFFFLACDVGFFH